MNTSDRDSPYQRRLQDRNKVNVATWDKINNNYEGPPVYGRCPTCIDHNRYLVRTVDGKREKICPGCLETFPLDEKTKNTGKYTTKYGTASGGNHSFILSMKGKKAYEVDSQTVEEICRAMGRSTSDGVTIVDSNETTYDSQGGWL